MIIEMSKVRVLGPRDRLADVLRALQDLGILHLAPPGAGEQLSPLALSPVQERERRHLRAALDDVERALTQLGLTAGSVPRGQPATLADLARWARLGWRVRRSSDRLKARAAALDEERALILKYQHFFSAFRSLLESEARWPNATAYHVLLRGGDTEAIHKLRASLTAVIGEEFQLFTQALPSGEIALLVVVSAGAAGRVERLLAEARVQEIPVPEQYGGKSLTAAIPKMLARLGDIPRETEQVRREREALARAHGAELRRARAGLHDRLRELDALPLSGVTPRAFVLEGWVPAAARRDLEVGLRDGFGDSVVVSEVSKEEWESEDAPVVLSNPRLLRPFETLIRLLPLPRYGTIDPTPFVAVFFPAFFGLIMGDVGYGAALAVLGLILHARSKPGTLLRNVSEIIGPCALFSIIAGFLYGELFGDLGKRWIGLKPLAFSREEALIPFLLLAVALGAVHVLLGLGLGVASNIRRHPRAALGRGLSGLMILLIILALLAAVGVLPEGFFTPAVIALLVAFPVLIVLEGLVAPIELLSTIGNILSYARIMALGVASVMLAVVANRMVGAIGSVAVGIVFALLFHLVNFAIALFSPTIHALRLHYVEFFGKFYSPGGVRYEPFGHWTRDTARTRA
ncbi:MAG TPA: V-type ATPase 116kDa subunit family protein [Gemmatimonadales bacterium]|nr:V-type ATPase 116kDa subunit family protein [Gemmatimonadales bacterium]